MNYNISDILNRLIEDIFNQELSLFGNSKTKGKIGETNIKKVLIEKDIQDTCYMRLLENVYIINGQYSTEIDNVLITEKGIFIIESKNYGGWIFGDEKSEKWMQIFPNGEKHQFYNPIKQNNSHMIKVAKYLEVDNKKLFSYIIFSDRCEFKQIPNDSAYTRIFHLEKLKTIIKHDLFYLPQLLTSEEVDAFYENMLPLVLVEEDEKKRHIEYVKKFTEGMECPVCGGKIALVDYKDGCGKYKCSNCSFERTDNIDVKRLRENYFCSYRPRYYKYSKKNYVSSIWTFNDLIFKNHSYYKPYKNIKKPICNSLLGSFSDYSMGYKTQNMTFKKSHSKNKKRYRSNDYDFFNWW